MEKPNILLLFTDQQRFDTIAAATGNTDLKTPNLDRLVKEGCLYNNAYTPNPVCIPARHYLLTSLPANKHKYYENNSHNLNPHFTTLPQILRDNGYDTRAIGKMHFVPTRNHNGFNKMELMEELPKSRDMDEYATYLKENGYGHIHNIHGVRNLLYMIPQQSLIPEEHHGTTWVADRSIKYLKEYNSAQPFFLWSSWIAPHPPFDVPDTFADLYKDVDLPQAYESETSLPLPLNVTSSAINCDIPAGKEKEYKKRVRELYHAAIAHVDKNIGRILDTLEEKGILDETIIIFTSDHGEMLGDHGAWQKMLPYDSSAKIPFIIRYPEKFKPGSTDERFVDLTDIMPTLMDIAGIKYNGKHELMGASILGDDKDRTCQYVEYGKFWRRWCSLRNKKYKFNYYYNSGFEQLFDMENDPAESVNLLETRKDAPEVQSAYKELRDKLHEKETMYGPEMHTWEDAWEQEKGFIIQESQQKPYPKNCQYQKFLNAEAKKPLTEKTHRLQEEVIEAAKNEELVKLSELDLDSWVRNGAPQEAADYIRKNNL